MPKYEAFDDIQKVNDEYNVSRKEPSSHNTSTSILEGSSENSNLPTTGTTGNTNPNLKSIP